MRKRVIKVTGFIKNIGVPSTTISPLHFVRAPLRRSIDDLRIVIANLAPTQRISLHYSSILQPVGLPRVLRKLLTLAPGCHPQSNNSGVKAPLVSSHAIVI